MIIFGVRESAGEAMESDVTCPGCGDSLYAVPVYKYLHVWFIPFFPVGKRYSMVCGSCGGLFNQVRIPYGKLPKQRAPWWTFSGLMLIGMFFIWMFIHKHFIA